MRTLTLAEAKSFYDRFGARQDSQLFYEAPALELLIEHGDFAHARAVFELGCGTGRLARELLTDHLPAGATYRGVDLSSTMVALARERVSEFADRTEIAQSAGDDALPAADGSADRFLSTYVLDLMSDAAIGGGLDEAHRILRPGGLLCLAGVTFGTTLLSRLVMGTWNGLFRLRPASVGGCRPVRIADRLDPKRWTVVLERVVVAYGVASEALVARAAA